MAGRACGARCLLCPVEKPRIRWNSLAGHQPEFRDLISIEPSPDQLDQEIDIAFATRAKKKRSRDKLPSRAADRHHVAEKSRRGSVQSSDQIEPRSFCSMPRLRALDLLVKVCKSGSADSGCSPSGSGWSFVARCRGRLDVVM